MEVVSKLLDLSDDAITIYLDCLGKSPLTYNEIQSFNPNLSDAEFKKIMDDLIKKKLLLNKSSENSQILAHYIATPPFFVINNLINQIKNDLTNKKNNAFPITEQIIKNLFKNKDKIELDNIYKDFTVFKKELDDDISSTKQEIENLTSKIEKKEEIVDFLKKYEEELKNLISSELASIVVMLLQLKTELKENIKEIGITDNQWDMLKNKIKDILALETHRKSQEINEIISEEFNEIGDIIKPKILKNLKDQFEQKNTYLKILNLFQNEINKLDKALLLKKNNLNLEFKNMENSVNSGLVKAFQDINKNIISNIQYIEDFLQIILKDYTGTIFTYDNFWPINSKAKISEEILSLLENSKKSVTIIVPNILDYVPLEKLKGVSNDLKIKIISTESHKSDLIKNITKRDNIEFNKLKNNNLIGLKGDNSYIIIGIDQNLKSNPLKEIIGFGTNYKPLIDILLPIFSEKLASSKPRKEKQITDKFNLVIENINDIKGKQISKTFKQILDFVIKMDGISLNVLDIKLLISKLKSIEDPLNDDMKQAVIEKIREFNKNFSNLELIPVPEFKPAISKRYKAIEATESFQSEIDIGVEESIDLEKLNMSFDIFLEKINEFKGKDLSKQIGDIIDLSLKFQGYSKIVEWKNELKKVDSFLNDSFKKKLKEDFKNWQNNIVAPKLQKEVLPKKQEISKYDTSHQVEEILADEEYFSPALAELAETTGTIKEQSIQIKEEQNIDKYFNDISQKLNNLSGLEISKILQNITDIILETVGYSLDLKDMKQWNSRLRKIKKPLEEEIKNQFLPVFNKWKNKYLNKKSNAEFIDYAPSFAITEEDSNSEKKQSKGLKDKFENLIQCAKNFNGVEISKKLLIIVDIILETKGYNIALKDIRQWISKTRAIRTKLEEETINALLQELEKWKNQFDY
ncbi:MAG: hypothetical protein ACFFAN_15945 [Promethearchaeota archaeon]